MANDLGDVVRDAVTKAARDVIKNVGDTTPSKRKPKARLSGMRGLSAGAGIAALAPLAKKGVDAARNGTLNPANLASSVGDKVGDVAKDKVDEAGGPSGMLKDAVGSALPFGGGDDDGDEQSQSNGMPGVGKGRRMPIQQAIDVAVPLETAYNQWTQYEDWPQFMHRVKRVTQEEETSVSFATKIWGKTKEFEAQIVTQRPDDRVKWRVSQGITHTGVVSFHELAPRLTRVEVDLDVDPGSMIEKIARGARHIKRAVRADLHRFKSFIEMQEMETGAWRGVIEDGEVVEDHDEDYDKDRDYAEVADIYEFATSNGHGRDDEDDDDDDEDESPEAYEDEDEEEEEEEAPKPARKRRAKPKAKSSSSRSRRGSAEDKPKPKAKTRSRG